MVTGPISKDMIDALLTAALTWGSDVNPGGFFYQAFYSGVSRRFSWDDASPAGEVLWRSAWEFTMADYTDEPCPPYVFERYPGTPDPKIVLDLIGHLEYHAGYLADDYAGSEVDALLRFIQSAAIAELPGPVVLGIEDGDRTAFTAR